MNLFYIFYIWDDFYIDFRFNWLIKAFLAFCFVFGIEFFRLKEVSSIDHRHISFF